MKDKMRKAWMIAVAVLVLFAMTACGKGASESDAGNSSASVKYKVGFSVPDIAIPFFVLMAEEMQRLFDPHGVELVIASANNDISTQISSIENLIAANVSAIIINPIEPNSVESVLKRAREEGIKVVAFGTTIENADVIEMADNVEIGRMLGEHAANWINEKLGGDPEVGLIINTDNPIYYDRTSGLEETFPKLAPNAKIVARQESPVIVGEAQRIAENMLTAHPNMKAILTVGDTMALGIVEAVKAAGRATDDFYVNGNDATPEALDIIKKGGVLRATLDMGNDKIPAMTVENVMNLINGVEVPKFATAPLTIVDASNIDEYVND